YPGTCRGGLRGRAGRSWRFNTTDFKPNRPLALTGQALTAISTVATGARAAVHWHDRRLGTQQQDVVAAVGDFVLRRADGLWAYQLAVVVDDAAQGITDVVRGEDLADNTPRQILLQRALQQPTPLYLHTPLVRGADGEKLSKQHGAAPLVLDNPLQALQAAATVLNLPTLVHPDNTSLNDVLSQWVKAWMPLYN